MAAFSIQDAKQLSHAYILASADRQACLDLALRIAAAAVCLRGTDVPCGECRACRKALADIHPDVIHIRREADKSVVTVDQIRAMNIDACVLPNESSRKVYIIDEADRLKTPEAQNAALKTLEEPPAGVIFLLCTEKEELLLPTVRSRCVCITLNAEPGTETEDSRRLAAEYLSLVEEGDAAGLLRLCVGCDKMGRPEMTAFLDSLATQTADRLCGRKPAGGLARSGLWKLQRLAESCRIALGQTVGMKHITGLLAAEGAACGGNRGKSIA